MILSDNQGNQYIELKELAEAFGYEYDNSEYKKYDIDANKCYIKNGNLVSGFEANSNIIYKYEEGTNLDYQYYPLANSIVSYNNKLYISLVDLTKALNCSCTINQNKEIKIYSMENLATIYEENLRAAGYTMEPSQNNKKTLAYGWIIASKNGIYSVLNTNLEEVIGPKYKSIYFDEYNLQYIVSNTSGQYGIITEKGNIKQNLKYDGLEILNYENMIYKVKNNNKYGILKSNGEMLTQIIYDEIGYKADPINKILYTLIIPDLEGKIGGETIVVKQNDKYGLIYLSTGATFLPCDHLEKLYSVNELGEIQYRIEAEKIPAGLLEYLTIRGVKKPF